MRANGQKIGLLRPEPGDPYREDEKAPGVPPSASAQNDRRMSNHRRAGESPQPAETEGDLLPDTNSLEELRHGTGSAQRSSCLSYALASESESPSHDRRRAQEELAGSESRAPWPG